MLLALALLFTAPSLTIQWGQVDITPPERLPLGGYTARQGRLMDFGGEPLYARCVLLRYGRWKEAVVSAEMLTIPDSLAREVRKRIPADVHLFLSATHTHSAPDSQMLNDRMTFSIPGIASYKSRWLEWYAGKIASCVMGASASQSRRLNNVSVSEFRLPFNRGRRAGADPDTLATLVRSDEPETGTIDEVIALFSEYAAHAVFYGPERNVTSGDWPGALARKMFDSPVLVGAIGDVSPHVEGKTPEDQINAFVKAFAEGALSGPRTAVWHFGGAILSVSEAIPLDRVKPHPNFGKDYKIPQSLAQTLAEKFAPTSASITAFRLGSLAVVGVPGEPTSHLGRRIKEAGIAMGFHSVMVVSHVNGWIGYILDPVDYSHGGYEANLSFYGPNEGEHVVAAAIEALRKLRSSG